MHIPNWIKWLVIGIVVVWLVTDPKGLASVVSDVFNGIVTFFKEVS